MATSPPAPLHASLPNAKKRPSLGPPSGISPASYSIKRPKIHPLRQTSFPAADATIFSATPSARSETGSITNSLVSGVSSKAGAREKRGRGRPRKGTKDTSQTTQNGVAGSQASVTGADESGSLVSGREPGRGARSIVSGRSGGAEGDDDDEGDWGGASANLDAADKKRLHEEEMEENRKLS